mmetsp:Transcript_61502/g.85564  ORF Transcript_61502/g.85564 Transcript_61502/m.85564 type:complete len:206 (-) Transcript_61502:2-619(-)
MTFALAPLTVIGPAIRPHKLAMPMLQIVLVLALVHQHTLLSVPHHLASSREATILELSFIDTSIAPSLPSLTILGIGLPLSFILAILGLPHSMSMTFAVLDHASVCRSILVSHKLPLLCIHGSILLLILSQSRCTCACVRRIRLAILLEVCLVTQRINWSRSYISSAAAAIVWRVAACRCVTHDLSRCNGVLNGVVESQLEHTEA